MKCRSEFVANQQLAAVPTTGVLAERQPEQMVYMVTLIGGRDGSRLAGDYGISIVRSFGAALQLKQFNRGHGLIQLIGVREGEFKTEMLRRKLTARGYSVRVINTIEASA